MATETCKRLELDTLVVKCGEILKKKLVSADIIHGCVEDVKVKSHILQIHFGKSCNFTP